MNTINYEEIKNELQYYDYEPEYIIKQAEKLKAMIDGYGWDNHVVTFGCGLLLAESPKGGAVAYQVSNLREEGYW